MFGAITTTTDEKFFWARPQVLTELAKRVQSLVNAHSVSAALD
ncbi:MAG: hypothetical protein AAGA31_11660 [Bacteroidota bacterium]